MSYAGKNRRHHHYCAVPLARTAPRKRRLYTQFTSIGNGNRRVLSRIKSA